MTTRSFSRKTDLRDTVYAADVNELQAAVEALSVVTTRGDLLRGGVAGAESRLALGTRGHHLGSDGIDVAYLPPGFVNVATFNVLTSNTAAQNTTGIAAALAAGYTRLFFPELGTYSFDTTINIPSGGAIIGAGRGLTILNYTGATVAFANATPGVRIYDWLIRDISITGTSSAANGCFLMDSVSRSHFENVVIYGYSHASAVAIDVYSPTSGYAVYNEFYNVVVMTSTNGVVYRGTSSNSNKFFGGGIRSCSGIGASIVDSNENVFINTPFEQCGTAWKVDATVSGLSDGNGVDWCRFENNTLARHIASANVRNTLIGHTWDSGNSTNITDSGTNTAIHGDRRSGRQLHLKSALQDSPYILDRTAHGGSETPAVVLRDSNTSTGTPVTLKIETERAGFFVRGEKGASPFFDISTAGKLWLASEIEIDGALNHDGTTVGFYGVAPITRPTALTAANGSALNTGDATSDTVIANMRTRIGELETKLQALGLIT